MNIIIDSNVLFSALIKDSKTRSILFEYDGFFLFPSYIFKEMQEHIDELHEKTKLQKEDFRKLLHLILKKVLIVSDEVLDPFKQEAIEIIKNIDLDDTLFIACALAYSDSAIWSEDKRLKKQDKIKILNTKELIEYFDETK
ncbi:MAG: PIN domain-containing protein [Nanoarchaeota archaeon]